MQKHLREEIAINSDIFPSNDKRLYTDLFPYSPFSLSLSLSDSHSRRTRQVTAATLTPATPPTQSTATTTPNYGRNLEVWRWHPRERSLSTVTIPTASHGARPTPSTPPPSTNPNSPISRPDTGRASILFNFLFS